MLTRVRFHRPMYTSENYVADYIVSLNMQRTFEDVLYTYKVDLVLAGHYHSYEVGLDALACTA